MAEWRIYASVNLTSLDINNGLSPRRRRAIIWTRAGILLPGPLEIIVSEILIRIQTLLFKKMHLKCRLINDAILSRTQYAIIAAHVMDMYDLFKCLQYL